MRMELAIEVPGLALSPAKMQGRTQVCPQSPHKARADCECACMLLGRVADLTCKGVVAFICACTHMCLRARVNGVTIFAITFLWHGQDKPSGGMGGASAKPCKPNALEVSDEPLQGRARGGKHKSL